MIGKPGRPFGRACWTSSHSGYDGWVRGLFELAQFLRRVVVIAVRVVIVDFDENLLRVVLGARLGSLQVVVLHIFAVVDQLLLDLAQQAGLQAKALAGE